MKPGQPRMGLKEQNGIHVGLDLSWCEIPPYKRKGILRRMEESKGIAGIPGNSEEIWILAPHLPPRPTCAPTHTPPEEYTCPAGTIIMQLRVTQKTFNTGVILAYQLMLKTVRALFFFPPRLET
eukprot:scaffold10899_cov69-Cyclotella_meneghiniana.AAC.1